MSSAPTLEQRIQLVNPNYFEGLTLTCFRVLQAGDLPTHKAISNAGGRSIFLPLDVTKDEDWQEGVAAALKEFGRVDV